MADESTGDSVVYVIGPGHGTLVKIGYSAEVQRRLADLSYCSPVPLYVLWTVPGGAELEAALHQHFRRQRRHGEWFDLGYDDPAAMVAEVAALMGAPGTMTAFAPRLSRAKAPSARSRSTAEQFSAALNLDRASRAETGRPISMRGLMRGLHVGQTTATELVSWLASQRAQVATVAPVDGAEQDI